MKSILTGLLTTLVICFLAWAGSGPVQTLIFPSRTAQLDCSATGRNGFSWFNSSTNLFEGCSNGAVVDLGAGGQGGSGITGINSQLGASQTLATGTTGTDFAVSSATNTHTFNLPAASATASGKMTTGAQIFAGDKTFNGLITATGGLNCTGCISTTDIATATITDGNIATANKDGIAATASLRTIGTGAQQAAAGNDARFPTTDEKAALVGNGQTPSATNQFITKNDPALPGQNTPAALGVSSQVNCNDRSVFIASTGGNLTLTSDPPIVAGSYVGQKCQIGGSSDTAIVTIPSHATVRWCGGAASAVIGRLNQTPDMEWTGAEWRQNNCSSAAQVFGVGSIVPLGSCGAAGTPTPGNPTRGNVASGHYCEECLTGTTVITKCYSSGALANLDLVASAGKDLNLVADVTTVLNLDADSQTIDILGTFKGRRGTGAPTGTDCDSAGEAGKEYIQTDVTSFDCMKWICSGTGGWKNQCGTKTACMIKDAVVSTDDNKLFGSLDKAITVKSVWSHYEGTAPTTAAQFQLVGMTHTPPTPAAPTAAATKQTVSAGNVVAAQTPIRWSVTNTPNPATDTYELCVGYDVN